MLHLQLVVAVGERAPAAGVLQLFVKGVEVFSALGT